jgi:hypothetical protein
LVARRGQLTTAPASAVEQAKKRGDALPFPCPWPAAGAAAGAHCGSETRRLGIPGLATGEWSGGIAPPRARRSDVSCYPGPHRPAVGARAGTPVGKQSGSRREPAARKLRASAGSRRNRFYLHLAQRGGMCRSVGEAGPPGHGKSAPGGGRRLRAPMEALLRFRCHEVFPPAYGRGPRSHTSSPLPRSRCRPPTAEPERAPFTPAPQVNRPPRLVLPWTYRSVDPTSSS